MKRELERIPIPGEHEARERAWRVAEAAFAERQPNERRPRHWRVGVGVAVATAVLVTVFTPPGRAVLDNIREAVGVKTAAPALFSMPAKGRLLVASDAGVWVVQSDGSKRLLGPYRDASWSPFGRFVVAARQNELAALEPDGTVRWTLARHGVSSPSWTGTATNTRIAYADRTGIRVVAGDGTGDKLIVRGGRAPLAWRPGPGFELAYTTAATIRVVDTNSGRLLWSARRPQENANRIAWSDDGQRLLLTSQDHLSVYSGRGRLLTQISPSAQTSGKTAVFRPGTHTLTVGRIGATQSTASLSPGRTLFSGTGVFDDIAWSPDGHWLLVAWPTADQWVFVHAVGAHRIKATSNVSEQFRSQTPPRIEGWSN